MRSILILGPNGKRASVLVTPDGRIVTTASTTVPAGSVRTQTLYVKNGRLVTQ